MFQKDADLSAEYNHMLNGKWDHMMDQTHIGYTFWNEPLVNTMPDITQIQVPEAGSLGVMAPDATFDRSTGHFAFPLSPFDMAVWQSQGFSLFDRGKGPVSHTIESSEPWLEAIPPSGTIGPGRPPFDVDPPPEGIKFIVNWNMFPADSEVHQMQT